MKLLLQLAALAVAISCSAKPPPKKVAAIVTEYRHNSHADVIVSRLLQTYTLDDKGERSNLKLVSLYLDQVPEKDTGRKWAKKYGVPIHKTIRGALTLGSDKLAVDGVLHVAEHGDYPRNAFGSQAYPSGVFSRKPKRSFVNRDDPFPFSSTSTFPTIGPTPSGATTSPANWASP